MEVEKYKEFLIQPFYWLNLVSQLINFCARSTWVERCRVAQNLNIMRLFISLSHTIPWCKKHVELEGSLWESSISVQGIRPILKQYLSTFSPLANVLFCRACWDSTWSAGLMKFISQFCSKLGMMFISPSRYLVYGEYLHQGLLSMVNEPAISHQHLQELQRALALQAKSGGEELLGISEFHEHKHHRLSAVSCALGCCVYDIYPWIQ